MLYWKVDWNVFTVDYKSPKELVEYKMVFNALKDELHYFHRKFPLILESINSIFKIRLCEFFFNISDSCITHVARVLPKFCTTSSVINVGTYSGHDSNSRSPHFQFKGVIRKQKESEKKCQD